MDGVYIPSLLHQTSYLIAPAAAEGRPQEERCKGELAASSQALWLSQRSLERGAAVTQSAIMKPANAFYFSSTQGT